MKLSCYLLEISFLFQLFYFLLSASATSIRPMLTVKAIRKLLDETLSSVNVDVITFGDKTECAELSNLIIQSGIGLAAYKVKKVWKCRKISLTTHSLVIFDSPMTAKEMSGNIQWQSNKRQRYHHFVHILNGNLSDIEENFRDGFSIDNVHFLVRSTENSIDLLSAFMFSPEACRQNQFVVINQFETKSTRWRNSNFRPLKYKNFHNCSLIVSIAPSYKPVETRIIKTMARLSNFRIEPRQTGFKYQFTNCSDCDLIEASSNYNGDRGFVTSSIHTIDKIVFVTPPGDLYMPLEKMFFMFQDDVWIAITATLLITLATIQCINFCGTKCRDFVYGRNIDTPTLNLISIFLNGGQNKVPRRNFARFMLMLFVIWSLVIRTCYQSELFKYLQADIRHPAPATIDDLIKMNFTYYSFNLHQVDPGWDALGRR